MSTPPSLLHMMSLRGRHALVCGASAGIGRATAVALAGLGCRVTPLARRAERLDTLLHELHDAGSPESTRFVVADLNDRVATRLAVEAVLGEVGPVHVLLNNSGGPAAGAVLEADESAFLEAFGRHVLASHMLTRMVLPGMREAEFGRIINVISTSVREPIANLGVSNTIRGAMASWSKSVSRELPPGVTINNILPGYTATERLGELATTLSAQTGRTERQVEHDWVAAVPEGRLGQPQETAAAIAFLASPAASYIRGVSLAVDGGRLQSI